MIYPVMMIFLSPIVIQVDCPRVYIYIYIWLYMYILYITCDYCNQWSPLISHSYVITPHLPFFPNSNHGIFRLALPRFPPSSPDKPYLKHIWLVVSTYPSEKWWSSSWFLSWADSSQYMEKEKWSKPPTKYKLYKKTQDGAVLIFRHVVLDVSKGVAQTSTASIEKTTGWLGESRP